MKTIAPDDYRWDGFTEDEKRRYEALNLYEHAMNRHQYESEEQFEDTFDLDLRVLTYLYLCENPNATQGDFAKKIGANSVALSRALNNNHFVVKSEWVEKIHDVLSELDLTHFQEELNIILELQNSIKALRRKEYVADIVFKHFHLIPFDEYTLEGFYWINFLRFGSFEISDADCLNIWIFWDYDRSSSANVFDGKDPYFLVDKYLVETPDGKATIFTTDIHTYDSLVNKYLTDGNTIFKDYPSRYRSIILVDLQNKYIVKEHILTKSIE